MGIKRTLITMTILGLFYGCRMHPMIALQEGKDAEIQGIDTINIKVQSRLMFVPVTIGKKTYNFLFDSGAPFSISKEIQDEFEFKVVTKGHIVDSDRNRQKVDYVKVDRTTIGQSDFFDQTAFVADFKVNPILKCLKIDGIVGSNLIRHADWLINMPDEQILISSDLDSLFTQMETEQSFSTDMQFNMIVDITLGANQFQEITIDYGSNGGLDLRNSRFDSLKNHHLYKSAKKVLGKRQTGLLGKAVEADRRIASSDSVQLGNLSLNEIEIEIGGNDVIGTQALSKMIVGINWRDRKLYFSPSSDFEKPFKSYGIYSGHSSEKELFIRAVLEGSAAYKAGLRAGMEVNSVNELDFEKGAVFCDYVQMLSSSLDSMKMQVRFDSADVREVIIPYGSFN